MADIEITLDATAASDFSVNVPSDDMAIVQREDQAVTVFLETVGVNELAAAQAAAAAAAASATSASASAAQAASSATGSLQKASNLSDLANASTARTNLGLGNAATENVGATAGTVAAGDDSRITGALQKASNLSDLASASTARTNLGLGTSATENVGTTTGTVAAGDDNRFVSYATRAAAAAATVPAALLFLQTGGYAAAGDGGAARYKRVGATSLGGFQSADSQWWALDERVVVPEMFGTTGTANDAAVLQNWLDYGTYRYLPGKVYLVNAASVACLTWSNGGVIFGDRGKSTIRAAATTPSTVDILKVQPAVGVTMGYTARDFIIDPAANGAGRHAIELSQPTVNQQLHNSIFHNLQIGSLTNGIGFSGNAIHQTGDASYGGIYTTTFSCLFITSGGIKLPTIGDSVMFRDIEINGYYANTAFIGMDIAAIAGAGGPYLSSCNVTTVGTLAADAACILLTNTTAAVIRDCEIEFNASFGIANRLIVLNNCIATLVQGGFMGATGTSTGCIRFMSGCKRNMVRDTALTVGASGNHFVLDAGVTENFFDHGCQYNKNGVLSQTPAVSLGSSNNPNFGIFTQAVTLANSWTGTGSGTYRGALFCTRMANGMVQLAGSITGGTTAGGTTITTLPADCSPAIAVRVIVPVFNGTAWSMGVLTINTSGTVVIDSFAGNTSVHFDNVTFPGV